MAASVGLKDRPDAECAPLVPTKLDDKGAVPAAGTGTVEDNARLAAGTSAGGVEDEGASPAGGDRPSLAGEVSCTVGDATMVSNRRLTFVATPRDANVDESAPSPARRVGVATPGARGGVPGRWRAIDTGAIPSFANRACDQDRLAATPGHITQPQTKSYLWHHVASPCFVVPALCATD